MTYYNSLFFFKYNFKVPVGALTSKPYAFTARSWELSNSTTIDIFDTFNSNITVSVRGSRPLRILPQINEVLNEEWITDKVRLSYEGYSRQRLVSPMLRTENLLVPCSWLSAFESFSKILLTGAQFHTISGRLVDLETVSALKSFSSVLGFENRFVSSGLNLSYDFRDFYLCFVDPKDLEFIDFLVVAGCDLKTENPIFNLKIKNFVQRGTLRVEFFGNQSSFFNFSRGSSVYNFFLFLEGRSLLSVHYSLSKNPFLIIGYSLLKFFDNSFIDSLKLFKYSFGIMHPFSGYLNSCEVGFSTSKYILENYNVATSKRNILFCLGVDEIQKLNKNDFLIYQGHNGSFGANLADLILPSTVFFEKSGLYVNNFGYVQQTQFIVTPPTQVRGDTKILEAFISYFLKIDDVSFSNPDFLFKFSFLKKNENLLPFFKSLFVAYGFSKFTNSQVCNLIFDYYRTDAITYSSKTLTLSSNLRSQNFLNYVF